MHARQTIREAIATILATTPTNWVSVLQTRIATQRQIWPFLMVYVVDEQTEQMLIHPAGIYDRSATIHIVGMLKMPGTGDGTGSTETVEDRMDALCAEVETKLTNATLTAVTPKAKTLSLQSTSMEIVLSDEDSNISHAAVTQVWSVTYVTTEGLPETLI
jgi:hypothetical protein